MLIGFYKRRLEYVFRHIGTSSHAKCMSVQRIAVAGYQNRKRILVTSQNLGDNFLIGIDLRRRCIRRRASSAQHLSTLILQRCGCHLHLPSVTPLPARAKAQMATG